MKMWQILLCGFALLALAAQAHDGSSPITDRDPEILWFHNLSAPSFGSAAAGDIDGDGRLEIVFGTYFNDEHIYALNAEDGSTLWSYDTGGCNDASPVIYDVDQDGALEVVVPASSPCRVYCFEGATGAVEWSYSTYPHSIDSPPAVADLDNDGRPEIVFGAFQGYVYCLNGENGSLAWQINLGTNSYIQSDPQVLDCDGDGQLDVIVAQWAGDERIYALRGDNGAVLWFSDLPEDYMYHGASFADIDEDNLPELVIGSYDGDVYVLNAEDGSLCWEYPGLLYIGAPTTIADLNNDGHLEIIFTSYTTLKVLSHTGALLWSYGTGGSIFRGASVADVNGDGGLDVVFGSDDGILRALRGANGGVLWTYNLEAHYGRTFNMDHAPVIADFNGDDSLDVFIVGGEGSSSQPSNNHGRAYALTAGAGSGPGWPMFRHDPVHSGRFIPEPHDATISLTPISSPIIIPPGGGNFSFNATLHNAESTPLAFQVWIFLRLPNGSWYGPALGPITLTLPSGGTLTRLRNQNIPAIAPAGEYVYRGYVGTYSYAKWDSSEFAFSKQAAGDQGSEGSAWRLTDEGWANTGLAWTITGEDSEASPKFPWSCVSPNPFNAMTAISFQLAANSRVSLKVFDAAGRLVQTLVDGWREAGNHEATFDGSELPSGIYIYRIAADRNVSEGKIILLK